MRRPLFILTVLLSHWRRHVMQLATLLIGLIAATALWSGVQALNQEARASYDRAAAVFGGVRTAALEARNGATFSQALFVKLRRAGWPVSPVLEGRVQIAGQSYRLLGIEPVTLPTEVGDVPTIAGQGLQAFIMPPGQTLVAPETLAELALAQGASPELSGGARLPPLAVKARLVPDVLVVDIGIAQQALNEPGRISRLLVGRPKGPVQPLESVVNDQLHLVEPSAETDLERLTDSFHLNLTAFGLLSFVVGLFIVNSAVGLAFEQRLPMLRTLRACGASAAMLNSVLIIELVALALVAGLLGLACGYFIAAALLPDFAASLRGLYGAPLPGQLGLRGQWWLEGILISVAGALAAAATSIAKAIRLPLLATAQPYAWQQAQHRWLIGQSALALAVLVIAGWLLRHGHSLVSGFAVLAGLLLGAALLLPALLDAALSAGERGARGALATWFFTDSRQQLSGLSLALTALLIALAVNVGVGTMVQTFSRTFVSWLDGRLTADIYLLASDDAQAAKIKTWLGGRSEVEAVLQGGRAETQLDGAPLELFGLPDDSTYQARWPLLQATADAWSRLREGDAVFVSEQLATRQGLAAGATIDVPTPAGDWRLHVVGLYADYGNPKAQIAVNVGALLAHFPQSPHTRLALRVKPGATPTLIAALADSFGLPRRNLIDQTTLRAESLKIFNRTFAVTAALNTFTLGVAGIALFTSLLTLAGSRLPQLAPLWAIGITRRQLAGIELTKSLSLALMTALLALPLGLLVAWCLIAIVNVKAFGWRLPFHVFPLQLLRLLGVAMLASFAASLLPVARLARMKPAELAKVFANER